MSRIVLGALLVALIGALGAFADQGGGNAAKELQGTWTVVSAQENGQPLPAERIKGTRVIVTADTITVEEPKKKRVMTYKLDASKNPKVIDMTETEGSEKGKTAHGIYALDGETLKLCYALPGKDRPKDFNAKADSGELCFAMKKANR